MIDTTSIEKSILVSVLEHDFVGSDDAIMEIELNPEIFTNPIHRLFIKAINRMKELGEHINSDMLRYMFMKAGKWDKLTHESALVDIMAHYPLGTLYLFNNYLNKLQEAYMSRSFSL